MPEATAGQLGTSQAAVDFSSASFPVSVTRDIDIGISFDFGVTNEPERGLALAPRIPFTAGTNDLAGTGETATTWTLTLSTSETAFPGGIFFMTLHGVIAATPAVWCGSTNTPSANVVTSGVTYLIAFITSVDSEWVQNGPTFDLVFNFDFLTNYNESVGNPGPLVERPQWSAVNDPLWNGLMQFVLTGSNAGSVELTAATFAGNTHDWHTGMIGAPMRARGRVVHDFITGQPYMSDIAVRDGFRDNVMVHPDNFDPSDPLEESPFTPPPGEGVVDDEVDNLEWLWER